jgi:hypothetical protein
MIGKRLKIAVQFVHRLHYGLEISKLVFVVVVVGKRFLDGVLLMQHRYLMVYKRFWAEIQHFFQKKERGRNDSQVPVFFFLHILGF